MGYRLAADALMVAHLAYIVFVVIGGLAALRARWLLWLHAPAVAWAVYVQLFGQICPLTAWEWELRGLAGQAGFEGSFVDRHLMPLIYPADMTMAMHWALGAAVLAINTAIYGALIAAARRPQRAR